MTTCGESGVALPTQKRAPNSSEVLGEVDSSPKTGCSSRRSLATPERGEPSLTTCGQRSCPEWIELLALLGPEVCVRVVVAFGRFYGGDERSVEAVSVGDRWLAAVGTAEADAVAEEARQMSIEGTLECWERISRLIFCPSDHLDSELWLLLGDERGREDLGKCEDAVCAEVCKWALAI